MPKKLSYSFVLICSLVILTNLASATVLQDTLPTRSGLSKMDLKDQYLKKSENQKKAAYVLLAGGLATSLIGFVILIGDLGTLFTDHKTHGDLPDTLMYSGLAIMACSIPLFIAARKNKQQARLYIKKEAIMITPDIKTGGEHFVLGLKIGL